MADGVSWLTRMNVVLIALLLAIPIAGVWLGRRWAIARKWRGW